MPENDPAPTSAGPRARRPGNRALLLAMLAVALLLAGGLSFYASSQPDGLNKVAADQGFNAGERQHDLDSSPVAGYEAAFVDDPRLSKAVAGVSGVGLTLLLGGGLFLLVRRSAAGGGAAGSGGPGHGSTDHAGAGRRGQPHQS